MSIPQNKLHDELLSQILCLLCFVKTVIKYVVLPYSTTHLELCNITYYFDNGTIDLSNNCTLKSCNIILLASNNNLQSIL